MAKDKNVTGEEILDICSAYMSANDLKLVEKPGIMRQMLIVGNLDSQENLILFTLFKWQVSWQISILMQ